MCWIGEWNRSRGSYRNVVVGGGDASGPWRGNRRMGAVTVADGGAPRVPKLDCCRKASGAVVGGGRKKSGSRRRTGRFDRLG